MNMFTVDEAAGRWRCSLELVEEFLRDFAAARYVEKVGVDAWKVTAEGLAIAYVLSLADDREPVA